MLTNASAAATDAVLGAELCRYRPRPQKDMLRDLGFGSWVYYLSPVFLLLAAICLSAPVVLLAAALGAPGKVLLDRFWGPVLIAWFALCVALMSIFAYVLPRRVYLSIHEKGFVYQRPFRRWSVVFGEIAQCIVPANSRGFTLVLRNSTRLWFANFVIQFPQEGVVQLLERINRHLSAGELRVTQVDADVAARFRRAGWLVGLLIYAILVVVPVAGAECRRVMLKACGQTVWGMPYYVFAPLLCAILFAPLVYVMVQLMVLKTGRPRLLTNAAIYSRQELRKAWIVVILGGIYFFILVGLWIAYASVLGI
jgi:hypothetical protein